MSGEHVHLQVSGVGWSTPDGRRLLDGVSFSQGNELTGLVGRNGSGKTTLLRMLAGEIDASEGAVLREASVGYLPQNADAAGAATVGEALGIGAKLAALSRIESGSVDAADFDIVGDDWDIEQRARAILGDLGLGQLDLELSFDNCSGGEQTRILLAKLMIERHPLLLLDEPTNNLDSHARDQLIAALKARAGGAIIATHDRAVLRQVDRIFELSSLGFQRFGGNFDRYAADREASEAAAERQLEIAEAKVKAARKRLAADRERQQKQQAAAARRARNTGAFVMAVKAAKERSERSDRRISDVGTRIIETAQADAIEARQRVKDSVQFNFKLPETSVPANRRIVTAKDLTFGYSDDRPLFERLSFDVVGPERLSVAGRNGAGKSTLLRMLAGGLVAARGEVLIGTKRVAYLDQKLSGFDPDLSILDNFRARNRELTDHEARSSLARFHFRGSASEAPFGKLSGGQRIRAALACTLMTREPPQLLMLDEPTNHLDLDSIEALQAALNLYEGALIVVSHDAEFLSEIGCVRSIALGGS